MDPVDEHPVSEPAEQPAPTTTTPTAPTGLPDALLPGGRILVNAHRQATGQTIAPAVLAERMRLDDFTAGAILTALGETTGQATTAPARINGAVLQETSA